MEILSNEGCKYLDDYTIQNIGIPSIVLMENAANKITESIKNMGNSIVVFCGTGNNGGDGLAIARKLNLYGKEVQIIIVGNVNKASCDFKTNLNIVKNLNINITEVSNISNVNCLKNSILSADYVVDALFGVGLNRDITGIFKEVINLINTYSNKTISIDIPSGLDGNSGKSFGVSIKADITYTIEVLKKGFFINDGIDMIGKVEIVNIDVPSFLKVRMSEMTYLLSREEYKGFIKVRNKNGHKGNYGKVLVIAGSEKYTGAAFISTESCVRTGSGLVTLLTHKTVADSLRGRLTESMIIEYKDAKDIIDFNGYDIIACGPGLSTSYNSKELLNRVINETKCNLVLDADALNIISEDRSLLEGISGRAVLTPHLGEMARLTNKTIKEVSEDRIDLSKKFANDHNIILLLKGYNTVITDGKEVFINPTGNSKMASGGMGDCLTGIITSFCGQKLTLLEGALLGAYIHGLIGDELSRSRYIVNARDIIENLPKTIQELCEKENN
ncbi:NAD(P)H-hydrate dehydratase [Clostridium sp.]|uniref:NAD(P)H-hydrate dehydratase n=1 Tax=Clostridium sp. TaxID=1506 RepID=UPI002FC6EB00